MPKILELKTDSFGVLWARVGRVGEFESGISLYTPTEINQIRRDEASYIIDLISERRDSLRKESFDALSRQTPI